MTATTSPKTRKRHATILLHYRASITRDWRIGSGGID